jgi:membrane-bound inhibitor of C-type lysozyme
VRRVSVLAVLGLAACQTPAVRPASVLHCDNGEVVEARYAQDVAVVRYGGREYVMHTAMSASGARYVGGGMRWWTKGLEEGTIAPLRPGESVASARPVVCRAGPPPPAAPNNLTG